MATVALLLLSLSLTTAESREVLHNLGEPAQLCQPCNTQLQCSASASCSASLCVPATTQNATAYCLMFSQPEDGARGSTTHLTVQEDSAMLTGVTDPAEGTDESHGRDKPSHLMAHRGLVAVHGYSQQQRFDQYFGRREGLHDFSGKHYLNVYHYNQQGEE